MKTYKNLYPRVHDFANLYRAFRRARRAKRDRVAVASFEETARLATEAQRYSVSLWLNDLFSGESWMR